MTEQGRGERAAIAESGGLSWRSRGGVLGDARLRGVLLQAALVVAVVALAFWLVGNTNTNLERRGGELGFDFLGERAGFDVAQKLIPFTPDDTFFRAFLVGLANTLLVAVIGIALASVLGFAIGIARLSPNWLLSRLAGVYVETIRNVPLLLQLFFWYRAVLAAMPPPSDPYQLPLGATLSTRGLIFAKPVSEPGFGWVWLALLAAVGLIFLLRRLDRSEARPRLPLGWIGLGLVVVLPALAFLAAGTPLTWEQPVFGRFNFDGGIQIIPELFALVLGLVVYTAAFIAEVVRAGVLSVPRGQVEAARSLGLRRGLILRKVVVPQALRVIIPPLTNQYLNLTKNSSLAVAIGYPDLVGVFKNTVLNLSGHAIEVVFITMMVYLALSLLTSLFMNWFNARLARTERR